VASPSRCGAGGAGAVTGGSNCAGFGFCSSRRSFGGSCAFWAGCEIGARKLLLGLSASAFVLLSPELVPQRQDRQAASRRLARGPYARRVRRPGRQRSGACIPLLPRQRGGEARQAKVLTKDGARRIAVNVARRRSCLGKRRLSGRDPRPPVALLGVEIL
jgi:hypothetical protein